MKAPAGITVGACTHTGLVRSSNEDDYLLGALPAPGAFLAAIADGMGGMAGGAEASRTALRALGACVLDGASKAGLPQRVRDGFAAASARVFDAAAAVPALRDMGTTMTALCLADGTATVGHVGDTRLYRRRDGTCEQLTTDHAVREPDNLLTRCIGVGNATTEVDHAEFDVQAGDRFVLASDGVWSVLPPAVFARLLERDVAQQAAEALVGEALAAGGPDNATVLIVDVTNVAPGAAATEAELPREERPDDRRLWPRAVSLRAPAWPWLLFFAAAVLLAHAGLRWWGVDGGLGGLLPSPR